MDPVTIIRLTDYTAAAAQMPAGPRASRTAALGVAEDNLGTFSTEDAERELAWLRRNAQPNVTYVLREPQ